MKNKFNSNLSIEEPIKSASYNMKQNLKKPKKT
jgi:hypothetical protein